MAAGQRAQDPVDPAGTSGPLNACDVGFKRTGNRFPHYAETAVPPNTPKRVSNEETAQDARRSARCSRPVGARLGAAALKVAVRERVST